ncbi:Fis family transcriptional regulator [Pyrobaculum arsenaticum]|nr:Fis family transcriptional regulator [Pyrobaculum arsenaticum]
MLLRNVLKLARAYGAFTAGQAAYVLEIPLQKAVETLECMVSNGLLSAVDIAGVRFYYRDPVEAAEAILGSVDLSALPYEERAKLSRL